MDLPPERGSKVAEPAQAPREMLSAALRARHRLSPANPRTGPPPCAAQNLENDRGFSPPLCPQHRSGSHRTCKRCAARRGAGRCAGRPKARKGCAAPARLLLVLPADPRCSHRLRQPLPALGKTEACICAYLRLTGKCSGDRVLLCSGSARSRLVKITGRPHTPYQLPMKLGKNTSC